MAYACFSNIRKEIITQLDRAQTSIKIAVCWFTSQEVFDVLLSKLDQRADSKVSIELIITNDANNNKPKYGVPLNFGHFIEMGGRLYFGKGEGLMHNKYCIIDDAVLINGSYNWTVKAEQSYENIVVHEGEKRLLTQFRWDFRRIKRGYVEVKTLKMYEEIANCENELLEDYTRGDEAPGEDTNPEASTFYETPTPTPHRNEHTERPMSSNKRTPTFISNYHIGLLKRDGLFEPIIPAGHMLPVEVPAKFYIRWDGLDRIEFEVVCSSNFNGRPCKRIGMVSLAGELPRLKVNTEMYVILRIESKETLVVTVHIPENSYESNEFKMLLNGLDIISTLS